MRKIRDVVEYTLGSAPTLDDLRQIVTDTLDLDPNLRIHIERQQGQRDAETHSIVINRGGFV